MSALPPRVFKFGVFELHPASGELRRKGVRIKLQKQPQEALLLLLESAGRVVTREEFRERLWPGQTFVDVDVGLNKAVGKIREALDDSAQTPRYVETLPQHGYRFIGPLTDAEPVVPVWRPPRRFFVACAMGGLTLLLLLAYWRGTLGTGPSAGEIKALAVLPLLNLSGDVEQEYFSDGITDALITELGKVGTVRVISRQSVIRYKGTRKPLAEISRELSVEAVVEGSVQRFGDRVRITAQLVQVKPERHLWAQNYERPYSDILVLQGEIAREAARRIKTTLTPLRETWQSSAHPVDREAYEAYLRGKFFFHSYTPDGLHKAINSFEAAIRKDPKLAIAWAELAPAYGALGYWGYARPSETHSKARIAGRKAVELDDKLAEGHCSVGSGAAYADFDWTTAEIAFKRAIELNPSHAGAHANYGMVLGSLRRIDEAMDQLRIARELDPFQPRGSSVVGWGFYISGRYKQAIAELTNAVEMAPDFFIARWYMWRALHRTGEDSAALAECRRMYELLKDDEVVQALQRGYRRSGYPGAMREAAHTLTRRSRTEYVSAVQVALLFAHAGESDQALEWIEKAYEDRDPRLHTVWADPDWEKLYSKPRFLQLLRKMGFPSTAPAVGW